eukprot:jgi/Bigna1/60692/fgenesh1_kg.14_\
MPHLSSTCVLTSTPTQGQCLPSYWSVVKYFIDTARTLHLFPAKENKVSTHTPSTYRNHAHL